MFMSMVCVLTMLMWVASFDPKDYDTMFWDLAEGIENVHGL